MKRSGIGQTVGRCHPSGVGFQGLKRPGLGRMMVVRKCADWLKANIPEPFLRGLRTSNLSKSLNLRIKRRTRAAGLFLIEPSVLRLVTSILIEPSEEWETGRACLPLLPNTEPNTPPAIRGHLTRDSPARFTENVLLSRRYSSRTE